MDYRLDQIPGVGPKRHETLNKIGIYNPWDLLKFFPIRYIFRNDITSIKDAENREDVATLASVVSTKYNGHKRLLAIKMSDVEDYEFTVWFYGPKQIAMKFPNDSKFLLWGKVMFDNDKHFFFHPNLEPVGEDAEIADIGENFRFFPVYPLRAKLRKRGLGEKTLRKIIKAAAENFLKMLKDPLPETVLKEMELPDIKHAIWNLHFPKTQDDIKAARLRFAFSELFEHQSMFRLRKFMSHRVDAPQLMTDAISEAFNAQLEFDLTIGQKMVWMDILRDFSSENRMARLLQGDVGSGKTLVAMEAALCAIDSGYQVAFVIPSTVLAFQHFRKYEKVLDDLGVACALLTGKTNQRRREHYIRNIKTGFYKFIVGTQVLLNDVVQFKNLGLVIIDEQQRFGVQQRMKMLEKEPNAHFLMMSATPIPRTVALADYGDLDISIMKGFPSHRTGQKTYLRNPSAREKMYSFILDKVNDGEQAFFVYPIIEDSEKISLESAKSGYEKLVKIFGENRTEFLHGRMKEEEKVQVFDKFASGETRVLVTTSVVEVGVDVHNATIMVIEDADFFGMSQLHQLRGRVGRGQKEGMCVLVTKAKQGSKSHNRLKEFSETTDGFKIAELDLEYRGEGDLFGNAQSGFAMQYVNPREAKDLLEKAQEMADKLFKEQPPDFHKWVIHLRKKYGLPDGFIPDDIGELISSSEEQSKRRTKPGNIPPAAL